MVENPPGIDHVEGPERVHTRAIENGSFFDRPGGVALEEAVSQLGRARDAFGIEVEGTYVRTQTARGEAEKSASAPDIEKGFARKRPHLQHACKRSFSRGD